MTDGDTPDSSDGVPGSRAVGGLHRAPSEDRPGFEWWMRRKLFEAQVDAQLRYGPTPHLDEPPLVEDLGARVLPFRNRKGDW